MRYISVYVEAGIEKVYVEEWKDGKRQRKKSYLRSSPASMLRLAGMVQRWQKEGRISVRPFLGGCVGYVAEEPADVSK